MTAEIIDGRRVAADVDAETVGVVERLKTAGTVPSLAVVLVGEDPASQVYVNMKGRACERLGLRGIDRRLPTDTTQEELDAVVDSLNADLSVHGILVQLPIPAHLDPERVIAHISPEKDVDGLHPTNLGLLLRGQAAPRSCTPWGVMRLLSHYGVALKGAEAVVVGRSTMVGKPMALMLLEEHATVTMCHSRTRDLAEVCRRADVLVAAVGTAGLITADHVKPGAVVIDVGTSKVEGKLTGDVVFEEVAAKAGMITPVPGGVGPMTIAMLMHNTVEAAAKAAGI